MAKKSRGYYGVDLDGTLAEYQPGDIGRYGHTYIGPPIPKMVARVKKWLAEGREVKIITARMYADDTPDGLSRLITRREVYAAIKAWTKEHIGVALNAQAYKCYDMIELWDDRAVQVIRNTGERADGRE